MRPNRSAKRRSNAYGIVCRVYQKRRPRAKGGPRQDRGESGETAASHRRRASGDKRVGGLFISSEYATRKRTAPLLEAHGSEVLSRKSCFPASGRARDKGSEQVERIRVRVTTPSPLRRSSAERCSAYASGFSSLSLDALRAGEIVCNPMSMTSPVRPTAFRAAPLACLALFHPAARRRITISVFKLSTREGHRIMRTTAECM